MNSDRRIKKRKLDKVIWMVVRELVGAIFPIPHEFLGRFFDDGKKVFVKFPTLFKRLRPGMKLLFYSSHKVHAIVGEATIEEFEIIHRNEVLKKYKERLFLTPEEFMKYSAEGGPLKRKSRMFCVCVLKDIKRYKTPVTPKRYITPAGEYLIKSDYKIILSKSKET